MSPASHGLCNVEQFKLVLHQRELLLRGPQHAELHSIVTAPPDPEAEHGG